MQIKYDELQMLMNKLELNLSFSSKICVILDSITTIILMIVITCIGNYSKSVSPIPENSKQMVLVITPDFNTSSGKLYKFERVDGSQWKQSDIPIEAVVGRNGLGWGRGQSILQNENPQKQEGDGRSPAGVYHLGAVFGFDQPEDMIGLTMPYIHITETLECIDDINSKLYNRIINRDTVNSVDWKSSEKMLEIGEKYHLGIIVEYNAEQLSNSGSCIFLHIWGGQNTSTNGCTAINYEELQGIVKWLNINSLPILVQLTKSVYKQVYKEWGLPQI